VAANPSQSCSPAAPTPARWRATSVALLASAPRLPDSLRYVAVEGVIGAGKTSLARMLAERMGARLVLEEFEENPFLPDFYREPERWAFHTQLAFLASRFRQQKTLLERDLFQQRTVSDYTFDKDRIFAHLTLSGDELLLYENVFGLMEPSTATPDLVVYLQSSADRLMHNVALRGRPYEKNMERSYLEALSSSYDAHFGRYQKGPLLIVDASAIDFVNHPEDFERLVSRIAGMAGQSGTVRFTPPATLELDFS
jgi:deoxyguanosine kinase